MVLPDSLPDCCPVMEELSPDYKQFDLWDHSWFDLQTFKTQADTLPPACRLPFITGTLVLAGTTTRGTPLGPMAKRWPRRTHNCTLQGARVYSEKVKRHP